ncbi:MAG: hypothetical protein NTW96_22065, partial [Planctomycetia bacterium]|nr:hypothetical protein [Planctomycetia bacterium]
MALNKRERTLAIVTGGLMALVAGRFLLVGLVGPPASLVAQRDGLAAEVEKKQDRLDAAAKARKQLDEWGRRSLPSVPETARSLYQNWLLEQLAGAKVQQVKVQSNPKTPVAGIYDRLPFTVQGRGTAEHFADFLYRFYSAGHLHKIRLMTIKPIKDSADLDVTLTVEALCLPGADRPDRLADVASKRLAQPDAESYVKMIGARRLFSPHQPPKVATPEPPKNPEPKPPEFEHANQLAVTGTGEVDGRPQAWLTLRTTGEKARSFEGETFAFKQVKGKVLRVLDRSVELEINGKRYTVALGQTIEKAAAPADKPPAAPAPGQTIEKAAAPA